MPRSILSLTALGTPLALFQRGHFKNPIKFKSPNLDACIEFNDCIDYSCERIQLLLIVSL